MSRADKLTSRGASGASARALVDGAKALGHPARLRILAMLQQGPLCVCQMTAILELASSTVSGHLNELRRSGLVAEDRRGKLVYYHLDPSTPLADGVRRWLTLVAHDERIALDRALIDQVRAIPIPLLTRAGNRLAAVGTTRRRLPARNGG